MMKPEVIALRSVMKEKGLNQSDLARLANCSTTYISRILGGSAPFGRIAQEKMFAALDVPEDEVRQRGEGAKNKSPVAELPVAAMAEGVATKADMGDVRAEVIGLRADMGALEARMTTRLYAVAIAIVAGNTALTVGLLKLLAPSAAP